MKKIYSLMLALLIVFITSTNAQPFLTGHDYCAYKKQHSILPPSPRGDSPNTPKHKFDVLNYELHLDIRNCFLTPFPHNFTGYEIVKFMVDTALSSITLNAVNTSLQINAVSMSGVSFTHSNNILTINLDRTYNVGEIVFIRIDYQHLNVADGAFYTGTSSNPGGVFTDCEPEGARKWFPCWDKPSDKATVDLTVKVPGNGRLGSNGRLNDSTLTGDTLYYHWISRDPVATYLVVMTAKMNYNLNIVYWHKISNPADSIPCRFYYNNGENPINIMNIIGDMTTYYSQKFGEYGFEKEGFTTAPAPGFYWGGMENQTLITFCAGQNCWDANLTSHEFAHQWFGDMITCGTWADIWMNEGFATYCEALYYEHTGGYSSYKNDIIGDANYYLTHNPGWPIYNPAWADSTPDVNTLFNVAITYDKGACVLHMLRYVVNDTNMFFNMFRNYVSDTANFKYKDVVTDDYTTSISTTYGQDLSWFINEWVKQPNHPIYSNSYSINQAGSNWNVGFRVNQTQSNSPFHQMPIVIDIQFSSGPDTLIRVLNNTNLQLWNWTFTRQPVNVTFDPNNDIVLKVASLTLGIDPVSKLPSSYALHQNYPNPFNPVTKIKYDVPLRSNVVLKIYNAIGELVSQPINEVKEAGQYDFELNASNLASGIYFYTFSASSNKGNFEDTKKMVILK